MLARILLEPQGGEGDGAAVETPAPNKGVDLSEAAKGLVAKHGDPTAALLVLLGENYQHRDRIRELSTKLPKPDAIVLEGDDARHWSHYRELGKPSDLRAALGERDTFKAEAGSFRKAEVIRSAAEVSGFKASVLGTLAKDLEIIFADDKGKDGKPVKVAVVKGEGDQTTPLSEYAETHWIDFLDSLRAEPKATAPRIGTPTVQRPRTAPAGTGQAEKRRPTTTF